MLQTSSSSQCSARRDERLPIGAEKIRVPRSDRSRYAAPPTRRRFGHYHALPRTTHASTRYYYTRLRDPRELLLEPDLGHAELAAVGVHLDAPLPLDDVQRQAVAKVAVVEAHRDHVPAAQGLAVPSEGSL